MIDRTRRNAAPAYKVNQFASEDASPLRTFELPSEGIRIGTGKEEIKLTINYNCDLGAGPS